MARVMDQALQDMLAMPDDIGLEESMDLCWDSVMLPQQTAKWEEQAERGMARAAEATEKAEWLMKAMKRRGCALEFQNPMARLAVYLLETEQPELAGLVLATGSVDPLLRGGKLTREMKCGAGVGSYQKWWHFT